MSTSLFSLIFAGVVGVGTFAGTLQQNVLKTEKPYIDKLFHEIERDIRDFSNRNPLTKKESDDIKKGPDSSATETQTRRKRSSETNAEAKSKNTLEVWTDIWVGLLNDYIQSLWTTNNVTSHDTIDEKSRNFSDEEKQAAIKKADDGNKEEKKRFKKQVKEKEKEIESIYEKMKKFLLRIEFPTTYKYDRNNNNYGPYENYIRKISQ